MKTTGHRPSFPSKPHIPSVTLPFTVGGTERQGPVQPVRRYASPAARSDERNEQIEFGILFPAFLAGFWCSPPMCRMGQQVLKRGIVFIDLAIAQVAGLGVTAANLRLRGPRLAGAGRGGDAALLGALLLTWTEKKWPEVQEALIGVLFVVAASAELLLLANNPHGGEHLKDLLVGQISGYRSRPDPRSPSSMRRRWWRGLAFAPGWARRFYVLFALVVTQSVQLVGIYLVFASLIIPALAAKRFAERQRLASAMRWD